MKISIIIPVYNVEPYITECLQSVARQTWQGAIECLIVDDCGTDGSIAEAEAFISSYQGNITFRILHHQQNRGLSAARNTGTDAATGEYIYYLDSDDMMTDNCIESLMDVAQKYPQAEMIQGGIINHDRTENYNIANKDLPVIISDVRKIKMLLMSPSKGLPVSSWNKLIKRDFLLKNDIRFIEGIIHEDVPFAFHLAQKATCIGICQKNTYIYRIQRTGSILNSSSSERSFLSRTVAYQRCLELTDHVYRDIQIRSLFQRWQYALLTRPNTKDAKEKEWNTYKKMICKSSFRDSCIIILHALVPHKMCSWQPIYSFFNQLMSFHSRQDAKTRI